MAKPSISNIQDLKLDKKNANRGTSRGAEMLDRSLADYGAGRSVLVDRQGNIIAGNKTVEAARRAGYKRVMVVPNDGKTLVAVQRTDLDLNSKKARELAIADNRIGEINLDWDPAMILAAAEAADISAMFSANELADITGLMREPEVAPAPQIDKADELSKKWGVKPGQLWKIGQHRLLCGSSLDTKNVARLMNGQKAQLCATDPPYLVGYDAKNHPQNFKQNNKNKEWHGQYADKPLDEPLAPFYEGFLKLALEVCVEDAGFYVWHASQRQVEVSQAMEAAGLLVHQQIIWSKNKAVLTHCYYMWGHEPCFFGWKKKHKPKRNSGDFPSTVWEVDVPVLPGKESRHPTEKPIALFTTPMKMHTRKGDLCYEPFSGSGTCMAAAQTMGRRCYAIELSPGFVGVALERMADMGLRPKLAR